ncbi:GAF domain-containing protein [Wenjunlia tyrosinilytica]|uniref:Transcriptional regulator n=1 Tax=Wenjunlia tyrosinilytica TaxID=1544741 RepID=A0A918DWA9_9ACTN|nr:GAF domain-containing protein [Wenjunlia tyrosinilytica]GGO85416.1 transcriptional regulator [Wenjunlia tyrosinilytica]
MSAAGTSLLQAAWPPGADPALLRRTVARAHEEFLNTGHLPSNAREVVRDSWRRCRGIGVDPDRPRPAVGFSTADLRSYRADHPLAAVLPVIRNLLLDCAQGEQLVAVTDDRARLMWVEGDQGLRSRAERIGFVEGAQWSEEHAGTNAPGTAVEVGRPVQIYASEHFSRPVHGWSCSAAPIRDPDTGELLGVVDLTGGDHIAAPYALALVRATVAAAEVELRLLRLKGVLPAPAAVRRQSAQPRLEALGRDRARFTTVHGRSGELSPRHSEILLLLARHPRGLTADALGLLLHEEESARVTVRAEMSRLRRLLGPELLASRPYRLLSPVATDADRVRTLLARGAHRRALAEYPGPLLPRSEAPGVVEEREELDGAMRSTLLRRGDHELLLRWLDRPENADDVEVLGAARLALPPGSPRRELVRARLERLSPW